MVSPVIDARMMRAAFEVSYRGTCPRLAVGCVLANPDGTIAGSAANGNEGERQTCVADGCVMDPTGRHCTRSAHAELRAIRAAGGHCDGLVAYVNWFPCTPCVQALTGAGVREIVWSHSYRPATEARTAADVAARGVTLRRVLLDERPQPPIDPARQIHTPADRPPAGTVHELKTWPGLFDDVLEQRKTFEVRPSGDRDFRPGDLLDLREFDPDANHGAGAYTGRRCVREVTYVADLAGLFDQPMTGMAIRSVSDGEPDASGKPGR